jgi:hypothetical protein
MIIYTAALAAGGTDNGPPGIREHYHSNYFGAFVLGRTATMWRRFVTGPNPRLRLGS